MANVYEHTLDTYDFFDAVVNFMANDGNREWENFIEYVAGYAAEDCTDGVNISVTSRFMDFLFRHGYSDKIADILYDAMKAFVNERISETGANFDYC